MRQPERRASSVRRAPSTPTHPDSVGKPPRRAMRNSLSQRLSRLAMTPGLARVRGDLEGEAIGVEPSTQATREGNEAERREARARRRESDERRPAKSGSVQYIARRR